MAKDRSLMIAIIGIFVMAWIIGGLNIQGKSAGSAASTSCSDSDGGINYNFTGTINWNNGTYQITQTDKCDSTGKILYEYYCYTPNSINTWGQMTKYTCPYGCQNGACLKSSVPTRRCGNGIVEGTEQCDDGNTISYDGCSSTCRVDRVTRRV